MERNRRRERGIKLPAAACLLAEPWRPSRGCQEPHYKQSGGGEGFFVTLPFVPFFYFIHLFLKNIFLALECPGPSGIIVTVPDLQLKFLWKDTLATARVG